MKFLFVGDFVPGGKLSYQDNFITDELLEYIGSFDLRVCTLECAIGNDLPFDSQKMASTKAIIYVKEDGIQRLKKLSFDVVTLANNHLTDLDVEGLKNTIRILNENGIKHCGAGMNIYEAKKPVEIVTSDGQKVAIIGCLFDGYAPTIFHRAEVDKPGVYQTDINELEEYIHELKNDFDKVIVLPHWAQEHCYMPPAYCIEYAKRMIMAGADAIFGGHPHIINPYICIDGKPCYFSMGNFLFPDIYLQVPRPMWYPENETERTNLKRIWSYPRCIDRPSLAVWRGHNRIGMAVEYELLKDSYNTRYKLLALSSDNILGFHKGINVIVKKLRMSIFGAFMKTPLYPTIRKFYLSKHNYLRRATHKISTKLGIVYDVKVEVDKD